MVQRSSGSTRESPDGGLPQAAAARLSNPGLNSLFRWAERPACANWWQECDLADNAALRYIDSMPRIETTRRIPYTPAQMFDLVADVEQYPRFFPLCEALRVRSRERKGDKDVLLASMDIGYKAIRETITSRVTLDRRAMSVLVELVDGPFRHLENRWQFSEAPGGGTDVKFFLAYELKSLMLQLLVGGLFDQAFRRCVGAFEERARVVYGSGGAGLPVPAT